MGYRAFRKEVGASALKLDTTQAQWRAVAQMPQVKEELQLTPSHFEGDDRPVEQVSWHHAVEFCARLSAYSGRNYTLPSEAQWEYACRAGMRTPFHFGERLSLELANYTEIDKPKVGSQDTGVQFRVYTCTTCGSLRIPFAKEETPPICSNDSSHGPMVLEEEKRDGTRAVGQFPANDFGLYDMHGNVWEWCLDDWHDTYQAAPEDGSAWLTSRKSSRKVLRGGSWIRLPRHCRSAYRSRLNPDYRLHHYGFRVVCLPQDSA